MAELGEGDGALAGRVHLPVELVDLRNDGVVHQASRDEHSTEPFLRRDKLPRLLVSQAALHLLNRV